MVTGFGDLDPDSNVRLAALAALGMALGVQSITAGFMIGLVRLAAPRRARNDAAPPAPPQAASGHERRTERRSARG
jgi:hypothetical protein